MFTVTRMEGLSKSKMGVKNDNLTVIKIGGSVITRKEDDKPEVNRENLDRVAKEIGNALSEKPNGRLIIVHGAGPFGHIYAKKYDLHLGLKSEKQVKGIGITHRWMEWLNHEVVKTLQENGVKAMPFQPSAGGILCNGKLVQFPLNVVEKFLDLGLVIVSHGDVLLDNSRGIGILSGDHLAPYLAHNLRAKRLILGTDVDGVFTADPKRNPDAKLVKEITPDNLTGLEIGGSNSTDVTGGMARKIAELVDLAKEGLESEIINITKPGVLYKALMGETGLGTIIRPKQ